uniref:HEAT repeat domain-containing protein n=1 Tax=candidate division WOR-3 bacterium TaxID=2052148 RepID=A0A7C4YQQ4_UNCW3
MNEKKTEFLKRIFLKCELPDCVDKMKEVINYYKSLKEEENTEFIEKLKEEIFEMISNGMIGEKIKDEIGKKGKEHLIKSLIRKLVIKETEPLLNLILLQFKDDDLIECSIEVLQETDLEDVSNAVMRFLERKKHLLIPYLEEFFNSKDSNLIMKGIKIAGLIRTKDVKERLEEFLKSSNLLIQRESLLTLFSINDQEALEIVERNFFHLMGKEQIEALKFIGERDRDFIRRLKSMEELKLNKELFSMIEKYDSDY